MKDLIGWWDDLLMRMLQLDEYQEEFIQPKSLWISGLFNPMSFLTAIMQVTSRIKGLALDDMTLKSDVTNTKDPKDIAELPEDGAYVHGFFLEGACGAGEILFKKPCSRQTKLREFWGAAPGF